MKRSYFTLYTALSSLFLFTPKSFASSSPSSVLLSQIARLYSMRLSVVGDKILLSNRYNEIEFEKNGRRVWINGFMMFLHLPCKLLNKKWSIGNADFQLNIDPILRSYKNPAKKIPKKIVLDPGHGGKDTGAIGRKGIAEEKIVLNITLLTKKILEKYGFNVYLTRKNINKKEKLSLDQRVNFAKKNKADLFISIHANAASSISANGIETFVTTVENFDSTNSYGMKADKSFVPNNKFNFSNAVLGYAIHSNLINICKRKDRGLRRARFAVTKNSICPSVLIECGFLSNPSEENLLLTRDYWQKVANGIANGIRGYAQYNK